MTENGTRLDGWKTIAAHLNKEVRTVIRWEKDRQLPVHRIPGKKRSAVYAWTSEIDLWLKGTATLPSEGNGSVETAPGPLGSEVAALPAEVIVPSASKGLSRKRWRISAALVSLGVTIALFGPWRRLIAPHLGTALQVTSGGGEKRDLIGGANSLFFDSSGGGIETIARVDQNGGRQSLLRFGHQTFALQDVSPGGTELLVVDGGLQGGTGPLWVVSTDGRPARRMPGLSATTAAWSPDGRELAYVNDRSLYLANANGTHPHNELTLPFRGEYLRWSPDGRRLRLSLAESSGRLCEVSLEGHTIRRLLTEWSRSDRDYECCGRWTPDGRFFVFKAVHNGIHGLWAIGDQNVWRQLWNHNPIQLMPSLNGVGTPVVSADGKKLFAVVTSPEGGDLMRYDPTARRFAPYPDQSGLSAAHTAFSPDGKHIAYVTHPQMCLWKMNADGTGRQMLTDHAALPQWSPDGRRIAFMEHTDNPDKPTKVRVISADGERPEQPVPSPEWQGVPTWTADGSGLVFGENGTFFPISPSCSIHLFTFKSGRISDFPNSTGLWTARACPTGRYIAAVTRDNRKLVLYDMRSAVWTELASFADSPIGANPTWSRDGKFIYVDAPDSPDPAIYRISVPGGRMEQVVSLKGIQRVHGSIGMWIGLTPDNLPLILRAVQSSEVWAWDWIAQ